jgi:glycosyltransferase involved in cell wall biosynthesis
MTEHARRSVAIIGTRGYPSYYGGFETAVRYLAPYLAESGWQVTVYGRPGNSVRNEADPRIETVETPGLDSKSLSTLSYGFTSSVHAAFRRQKPDVALVMNVANGYFLPMLRARRIPTLVNVDGIEWEREKWGRLARATFLQGARLTAASATELVVDAKAIGERWQQRWGRSGVFIPYGGEAARRLSAPPLGLDRGSYVLAVARLVPENSIPEFLEAASNIALGRPVVLVGASGYGGPLEEAAAALAARNDNFKWLGHVRDDGLLHSLWQNAGLYFHGHSVGGTNPALVQAMALGTPTLARDTVFNREVLGADGHFWAHPDEIVVKVQNLMGDPSALTDLRERLMLRARENYSWESVCAAYEAALESLVGRGA